ncbi:MAG: PEP-CTERM sorting domain-containing protein, partial [Opitutales bacterium]
SSLYNNNPDAFGYAVGGGNLFPQNLDINNVVRQAGGTTITTTTLSTAQPTDASFADGFTLTFSVLNDNTWSMFTTGLSTDVSETGNLDLNRFSYNDVAGDLGLYMTLQGEGGGTIDMGRMTLESVIPEPSAILLFGLSGLFIGMRRRHT